jgi:hypothetical protein
MIPFPFWLRFNRGQNERRPPPAITGRASRGMPPPLGFTPAQARAKGLRPLDSPNRSRWLLRSRALSDQRKGYGAFAISRRFAAAPVQPFGDEPPPDAQPSTSRVIKSCLVNIGPAARRFCRLSGCHGSGASLRVCRSARLYYSRRALWRDSLSG